MTHQSPSPTTDSAHWEHLATQAKRALTPVAPSAKFRARLREGLRMAASYRETRELLVHQRAETPWGLLVSAAALGSMAGMVAILLRARRGAPSAKPSETRHA